MANATSVGTTAPRWPVVIDTTSAVGSITIDPVIGYDFCHLKHTVTGGATTQNVWLAKTSAACTATYGVASGKCLLLASQTPLTLGPGFGPTVYHRSTTGSVGLMIVPRADMTFNPK